MMNKMAMALLLALGFATAHAADDARPLQRAIAGKHRSAEHKARDKYQHPEQTLEFFELNNDMTVVEIWPGNTGWWTEILAPFLNKHGKLYAAHFSADAALPMLRESRHDFDKKLKKHPDLYGQVETTVLQPPTFVNIAPDASADRVLSFLNVHYWMKRDQAATVFAVMYKALKPGGILGVVEHRQSVSKPQDEHAASGYVTEDYVIALARKAGFEFLGKSEINANSQDRKDYPQGVWTLPPTLILKDKDKKKYLAIGESDRMTIKFMKPK